MGKLMAVAVLLLYLCGCSAAGSAPSSFTPTTGKATTSSQTTTTAAPSMTTVTLGHDDPGRDYGTPDIDVAFDRNKAQQVLELMNKARSDAGLSPLVMDEGAMMEAAKTRAKDITVAFGHYRPNGDGFFTVFQQYHVDYKAAGENLAAGQPTASIAFNSWWKSETHHANMMNAHFTHVSIAVTEYNGELFWVQLFRK
ncbi:MAG: hypothetical protein E7541_05060 [Ruminococcaceae bacterium]|nr:hypothetical protein [Oscillospiraceae bacterium]